MALNPQNKVLGDLLGKVSADIAEHGQYATMLARWDGVSVPTRAGQDIGFSARPVLLEVPTSSPLYRYAAQYGGVLPTILVEYNTGRISTSPNPNDQIRPLTMMGMRLLRVGMASRVFYNPNGLNDIYLLAWSTEVQAG